MNIIYIIVLLLPYMIFVIMFKKVKEGEWASYFLMSLLWYLLWIIILKDVNILSSIANIGAYLGILLGGLFSLIGAIKHRKLKKMKDDSNVG